MPDTVPWTILFFINATDRGRIATLTQTVRELSSRCRAHPTKVRIMVQWGDGHGKAWRFHLPLPVNAAVPPAGAREISNPTSGGGGPTVACMLKEARRDAPADRYAIVFIPLHGYGVTRLEPLLQLARLLSLLRFSSSDRRSDSGNWMSRLLGFFFSRSVKFESDGASRVDASLTIKSLQQSLEPLCNTDATRISQIVMEGCGMGTLEVTYALRAVTSTLIAATTVTSVPNDETFTGWLDLILNDVNQTDVALTEAATAVIFESHHWQRDARGHRIVDSRSSPGSYVGLCASRRGLLKNVKDAVSELAEALCKWYQDRDTRAAAEKAIIDARSATNMTDGKIQTYDFHTFIDELTRAEDVPNDVTDACAILRNLLGSTELAVNAGEWDAFLTSTRGLTIYFQPLGEKPEPFYRSSARPAAQVAFAADSKWSEFLEEVVPLLAPPP